MIQDFKTFTFFHRNIYNCLPCFPSCYSLFTFSNIYCKTSLWWKRKRLVGIETVRLVTVGQKQQRLSPCHTGWLFFLSTKHHPTPLYHSHLLYLIQSIRFMWIVLPWREMGHFMVWLQGIFFRRKCKLAVCCKGGHNSISDSQSADCIPLSGHRLSLELRAKMPTLANTSTSLILTRPHSRQSYNFSNNHSWQKYFQPHNLQTFLWPLKRIWDATASYSLMQLPHWQVWCIYADIGSYCRKIRNSEVPNTNPSPFVMQGIICN